MAKVDEEIAEAVGSSVIFDKPLNQKKKKTTDENPLVVVTVTALNELMFVQSLY